MTGEIYAALASVMQECDHVAKRDVNTHQNFRFRGIDAVVNAVGPILRKHSVIVVPDLENVTYDTVATSTGKPATACRVVVAYAFYAGDGSSVTTRVAAEAWDSGDKAAPKAMSVAFRTALLQALALPTDDPDPDSQVYEREHAPRQERRQGGSGNAISQAQLKKLGALMNECGIRDRDSALAYVADVIGRKVGSRNELTAVEASKLIEALAAEVDKKNAAQAGGQ